MEIYNEINKNENIIIALGFFDGIHKGHQKIISTLVAQSKILGVPCAVVSFSDNPANYFSNENIPNISSFKDKQAILESLGVDYLYELDFEQYKDLSAIEYLKDVLIANFKPKMIIAGFNHTFGKDRLGNPQLLKEYSDKFGYECVITPEQKLSDETEISSSIIRKKIQTGQLDEVKALLGRIFYVRNSVIKGDKLATTLGYPTANLIWPNSIVKLPYGVYRGFVQVDEQLLPALISWSNKPTLSDGKSEIIEAHIYNFDKNLYGKIIKVMFEKKMRDVENFGNIRVLKTQLQKDYNAFEKWAKLIKG